MSLELKDKTGTEISLVPGSGGVFDVKVDDRLVFSKHKIGRFPDEGEITTLLN